MSKQKAIPIGSLVNAVFQVGLYKPAQGRVTRQVTCAALWGVVALCAWRLQQTLYRAEHWQYISAIVVLVLGGWGVYRLVNYPTFADFLIAVEAEMSKVSWPTKAELVRSSIVVIFVMFVLAGFLFGYDLLWTALFQWLGVLRSSAPAEACRDLWTGGWA